MESGPVPKSFAQFGVNIHPLNSPFADMSVEYDPGYPNEYADFAKRLKEQKSVEREEERRREDEERRRSDSSHYALTYCNFYSVVFCSLL